MNGLELSCDPTGKALETDQAEAQAEHKNSQPIVRNRRRRGCGAAEIERLTDLAGREIPFTDRIIITGSAEDTAATKVPNLQRGIVERHHGSGGERIRRTEAGERPQWRNDLRRGRKHKRTENDRSHISDRGVDACLLSNRYPTGVVANNTGRGCDAGCVKVGRAIERDRTRDRGCDRLGDENESQERSSGERTN